MGSEPGHLSAESWLVRAGRPHGPDDPLNTPIVTASNFADSSAYARSGGTPTWAAFEEVLGGLEHGTSIAFSTGMAAISAVLDLVPMSGHVALPSDCYHGVTAVVAAGVESGRWTAEHIDVTDTPGWLDALKRADLAWMESPTNPLLRIADLSAIASAPRIGVLAVDNTFATPLNQRPLDVGADVSVHSVTKFIGGHSDLMMGAVTTSTDELVERLRARRTLGGATPGALEAFLATRGIRTLAVRLERSQRTAESLARLLLKDDRIISVLHPSLESHPGHALAAAQFDGFGAMVSFEVVGGAARADAACRSVRLIHHTTSLGAVESTMERRAAVAGQDHLPPGLIRLSVGLEDPDDLWHDLSRALDG